MRDFLKLNAPEVLNYGDWILGSPEALNAWGWAQHVISAILALVLVWRGLAWAGRAVRKENVGAFILREFKGEGVNWVPEDSRLETLKASCKYFTVGPNGPGDIKDVVVCGVPVLHLLTNRQKAKLRKVVKAAVKKCRDDEMEQQQRLVMERTRKKVYRSS